MKNILLLIFFMVSSSLMAQDTSYFKSSDGEKLFYVSYGSGQKIVILYGGPGYGSNLIWNWHKYMKKYQCIFYDQRGTGLSKNVKMDTSTINLRMAVNDIEELRKHLNDEKICIMGFSWGAGLAMAYTSKYPDKVSNLVLISPIGPDLDFMDDFPDNIMSRRSIQEKDSLAFWSKKEVADTNAVLAFKMQTYYKHIPYFFDHAKGRPMMWKLISEGNFSQEMSKLMWTDLLGSKYDVKTGIVSYKGPCSVIRADQDVIGYKVICQITDVLPQSTLYEIPKCGHFVDLEAVFPFSSTLKKIFP